MKLFNFLLSYFTIVFNSYAFVKAYQRTIKIKTKIKIIDCFMILLASMIIFISNYYMPVLLKIPMSFMTLLVTYKIIFKENFLSLIFKTFIIYLTLMIVDLLVSVVFLFFPVNSVLDVGKITIIKALCTILDSLFLMLVFLLEWVDTFINKLFDQILSKESIVIIFLATFAFIVFVILSIFSATSFAIEIFLISLLLIVFFLFLCVVLIFRYFKNRNSEEEQKALLQLMTEYENILDQERINRHEMLNNLIIIKSFKNRSSVEFENTLDDIIKNYQDKKSEIYSNLYKLPSGLKGIIYYKMAKIKENEIKLQLFCSKDIEDKLEKLNQKLYFKICKILGIVLDNAIEATESTDDKSLLIDIYFEEEILVIYLENSFVNDVDINSIYLKGVSSKGTNRGYGLYIVNKIIEESCELDFEQHIDGNKFVTILKIKNPS